MTEATITIEDIPVSTQGQVAKLVKFVGQLDESNVDEKAKIMYDIIEKSPQNLHLLMDFEGLEYMNSKSIGYLTDWYGKVTEGGGKIVIAKARSNILDILQVVGLTQLVNCYPNIDEAKFALLGGPTTGAETPASPSAPGGLPAAEPAAQTPETPPAEPAAPAGDTAPSAETPPAEAPPTEEENPPA